MLEEGLRDVEDLKKEDQDKDVDSESNNDDFEDAKKDTVGAKYMKVINSIFFWIYQFILLNFQSRNMEDQK